LALPGEQPQKDAAELKIDNALGKPLLPAPAKNPKIATHAP
jgi:hypothetical protein